MIKIVTDSTAYMTEEFAKQHDISIVPLSINTATHGSYVEGMPGSFDEIFEIIESPDAQPKSSQPPPDDFLQAYNKILQDGNEVFVITISSSLSGTFNSATLAAELSGSDKVTVFDSRGVGGLTMLYIEEALKLIEKGQTRQQIQERLTQLLANSSEVFAPLSLKYLIRGGRIGGISATIGSLLHVKPLLAFTDGVLAAKKKVIGMQKAIRELVDSIPKAAKNIYVMVIQKSAFFEPLFNKVKEAFPHVSVKKAEVGPVIGVHVGPGTVGVAFLSEPNMT